MREPTRGTSVAPVPFRASTGGTLAFDSLDELCACPDADAVYISSPNAVHASQALACVRAGKHVLVEKAFASNAREAKRVFDAAAEQGVVAMDGHAFDPHAGISRRRGGIARSLARSVSPRWASQRSRRAYRA